MIDIADNLENHKAMKALTDALDIPDKSLKTNVQGKYAIVGKADKPMKVVQFLNGEYYYYVKAATIRRCNSIRKKLTSFGMKLHLQKNEEAYLSMRRLPETEKEATTIRNLLGISKRRPNSGANFLNLRMSEANGRNFSKEIV